ncbi:glycosyltransferase family 2 protein [Neobacillus niacini]|uniref:glycosyltransferase family 2 protein n=1 Tax=Neobacillus niacini TaxID=86668 RepID=UPI0021CB7875|nr:glycosyltransferase family 2 protein [Neobacillus niacini]MCM3766374.1 glycosyltransferase family 2 protein [Neobacillus niacini]
MSQLENELENDQLRPHQRKKKPKTAVVVENWFVRITIVVLYALFLTGMVFVNVRAEKTWEYVIGAFSTLSFGYLLLKVVVSYFYNPAKQEPKKEYKVSVIIPNYNESIESVNKSLACLLQQDYPIHEIIFVDDGSTDDSAFVEVSKMAQIIHSKNDPSLPKIITHQFEKNKGKKAAQAWGFTHATGDIFMLVDSDGYIFPDAVRELLKPFNDDQVMSVVGHINARNAKENFLTRLQDVVYDKAFRVGRGAQSVTNAVLVCSGAISMHRANMVVDHLDEFLSPTVAGVPCEVGDDRMLTDIALKYGGKTKYQSTAVCLTDVPNKLKQLFKQQVRWGKSTYLFSIASLNHAWRKPFMLVWLLGEGYTWFFFSVSLTASFLQWTETYAVIFVLYSLGYMVLVAFISGVYYFFKNPLVYLFSPIFALMYMIILVPIRVWALVTINKTSWGTR